MKQILLCIAIISAMLISFKKDNPNRFPATPDTPASQIERPPGQAVVPVESKKIGADGNVIHRWFVIEGNTQKHTLLQTYFRPHTV